MKKTYIYLSEEDKKTLTKTCTKNKVSLSHLTSIIMFVTYYCLTHYGINKNENELLQQEYIKKSAYSIMTSIKPKAFNSDEVLGSVITEKNMYATNCLIIYVSKRQLDYMTEEGKNHYYNMINEKLQDAREVFWDYNNFVRNQRRSLKQNKDYFKRAIEDLEGN